MTSSGRQPKENLGRRSLRWDTWPFSGRCQLKGLCQIKRNEGKTCRCNAVFWVGHWMRQTTVKDLFVLSGKI